MSEVNPITEKFIGEVLDDALRLIENYSEHTPDLLEIKERAMVRLLQNTDRMSRIRTNTKRSSDGHRVAHLLDGLDCAPFQRPGGPLGFAMIVTAATYHMAPVHDRADLARQLTQLDGGPAQHLIDHLSHVVRNPDDRSSSSLRHAVDSAIGKSTRPSKCAEHIARCELAVLGHVDTLRPHAVRMSVIDLAGDALARHVAFGGSSWDEILQLSSQKFELLHPEFFPLPKDQGLTLLMPEPPTTQ